MVEAYQRRTPLTHLGLHARAAKDASMAAAGVTMREAAHPHLVNIRGDSADPAFATAVKTVTGIDLPLAANTYATQGDLRILWLGPNEWLIMGPDDTRAEAICASLRQELAGQFAAVVDISHTRTVIEMSGAKARDILVRGISLDLHPSVFKPGQCVQTGLSRANVILAQTDDAPSYDILVLNSFADYLWRWLELVAEDFGLAVKAS